MEFIILSAVLILLLGVYFYPNLASRKKPLYNDGRRSGTDRRKSFIASKNRVRRSDKDRRQFSDRRREPRLA